MIGPERKIQYFYLIKFKTMSFKGKKIGKDIAPENKNSSQTGTIPLSDPENTNQKNYHGLIPDR